MNKRTRLRSPSLILCGLIAAVAAISPASAQHAGGGGHAAVGPGGWCGLVLGLFFPTLPLYYSTLWWDGIPYYYADNTYYRWNGAVNQYETVSPPPELQGQAEGLSAGASELIAYPKNGQSQEQQGKDKFECHRWAAAQTGFDPTQVAGPSVACRRSDYVRAP